MHFKEVSALICLKELPIMFSKIMVLVMTMCFQCFDAVGWAAGRASGLQKAE